MRRSILLILLASAGCSPSGDRQSAPAATNVTAAVTPTNPNLRHAESKNSPAAKEARALAVRYYDLIKQRKYEEARKLWGHDGADAGGSAKDLGAMYQRYSVYETTVGAPTDIHVADGKQFIDVAIKAHVKVRSTGKELDQEGPLMMRRSIDPHAPEFQERNWQIWGTDIRVPH